MGWKEFSATNTFSGPSETPVIGTISIENVGIANAPFVPENGFATVSFSVSYTGTPTSLEYALFNFETGNIVTQFATFDSSPSNESSILTFTVPTANTRYGIRVRFGNNNSVIAEQSKSWLASDFVIMGGQSLFHHLNTDDPSLSPAGVYKYTTSGGVHISTGGRGQAELGKIIVADSGGSVVISNTAIGGTCMTEECAIDRGDGSNYWFNPDSALSKSTTDAIELLAPHGKATAFAFAQGQTDAVVASNPDTYLANLTAVVARVRALVTAPDGSELPVVIGILGRNTSSGSDATAQAIREKQLEYLDSDSNAQGVFMYPYSTDDGTHPDDSGDILLGQAVGKVIVGAIPPKLTGITLSQTKDVLTLTYDSDLANETYSLEGIRVEADGGAKTISSFARTGNRTADITLTSAITDASDIDVYVGWGTGNTSNLLTYPSSSAVSGVYALPFASKGNDFTIQNTAPTVSITGEASLTAGAPGTYTANINDPDAGDSHTYIWRIVSGDGSLNETNTASVTLTSTVKAVSNTVRLGCIVHDGTEPSEEAFFDVTVAAYVPPVQTTQSTLRLKIAGLAIGLRDLTLFDMQTKELLFTGDVLVNKYRVNVPLTPPKGTKVFGWHAGSNPPYTSTGVYGVTE
ncbi:hypothetical protein Patl_0712 [Paraglaciecola sp. T6c]|uniref:sialate O-acetylesterase n=1 Tax=Pseudoalteromonas atlantica (strain T6c / ATCC BAA-1087) TaxID=3042615 RepID=UPI00005C602B|nr:sialate O-acetylesterase [Paraglaciecola sp. T6c]ABG39240.1 hypothetical protein Patl_0712 [Paraglaciecola sp. T6c]